MGPIRLSEIRFDPRAAAGRIAAVAAAGQARPSRQTRRVTEAGAARRRETDAPRRRLDQRDAAGQAEAFKAAIQLLVREGPYGEMVAIHLDMSHNMHGAMHGQFNPLGLFRFLPWHRRYLLAFEEAVQRADRQLRSGAPDVVMIPYWRARRPAPPTRGPWRPKAAKRTSMPVEIFIAHRPEDYAIAQSV